MELSLIAEADCPRYLEGKLRGLFHETRRKADSLCDLDLFLKGGAMLGRCGVGEVVLSPEVTPDPVPFDEACDRGQAPFVCLTVGASCVLIKALGQAGVDQPV